MIALAHDNLGASRQRIGDAHLRNRHRVAKEIVLAPFVFDWLKAGGAKRDASGAERPGSSQLSVKMTPT